MHSLHYKFKSNKITYLLLTMIVAISLSACGSKNIESESSIPMESTEIEGSTVIEESKEPTSELLTESTVQKETETIEEETESAAVKKEQKEEKAQESSIVTAFKVSDIPEFAGRLYVDVNKNVPYFTEAELQGTSTSYEQYANLDSLGRCGTSVASVGQDIMPTEERGKIGEVRPTGWKQHKYAGLVEGNYLYNRCHLIGYQLTGENANIKNLITGTRCFNTEGILPFENMVADYVKETNKHVLQSYTNFSGQ